MTKENKVLVEKLRYREKSASVTIHSVGNDGDKEQPVSRNDPTNATTYTKVAEVVESSSKTFQAGTYLFFLSFCIY